MNSIKIAQEAPRDVKRRPQSEDVASLNQVAHGIPLFSLAHRPDSETECRMSLKQVCELLRLDVAIRQYFAQQPKT